MMTELDLAQSVAEGTTSTPARIGENSWLVMLRISGTGCAFRPAHQEFAFREADVWLSQSMMRRWIGVGTPGRRPTADTGRSARSPETVRSPRNQRPIRQKMTSQKKIKWASSSKLVMLSPTLGACRTGGRELATACDAIGRIPRNTRMFRQARCARLWRWVRAADGSAGYGPRRLRSARAGTKPKRGGGPSRKVAQEFVAADHAGQGQAAEARRAYQPMKRRSAANLLDDTKTCRLAVRIAA